MRWGAPYKGSKNQIAEWVIKQFPRRKNFYDLLGDLMQMLRDSPAAPACVKDEAEEEEVSSEEKK